MVTNACRIYNWVGTNLAEQARVLWYGEDLGQPCTVTADAAERISGVVAWGGASWVRPDFRGRHLSHVVPRILKAYACARWPIDWSICFIGVNNVKRGLAASYGHKNLSFSITYPGSALGEMALAYTPVEDFYAELTSFLESGSDIESEDVETPAAATGLEHIVTNTSSDGVFQGSISRS